MTDLVVDLEPGTPQPGAWCHTCQLPSAWTTTITQLDDDGVRPVARIRYCPECDDYQTGPR